MGFKCVRSGVLKIARYTKTRLMLLLIGLYCVLPSVVG